MEQKYFDILIIGGGHAGCESAWSCSQFDLRIGLVSMKNVGLASAPCNPAIGGVGKGQVVRELDALGGFMPEVTDKAAIQYRRLNESKGYAVQSTRVQIDKEEYSKVATKLLKERKNLDLIFGQVRKVSKHDSEFSYEVKLQNNESLFSKALIVTAGTFLNGKLHCGSDVVSGGRAGSDASVALNNLFEAIKTLPNRFKTGTPARIHRDSIDFTKLEEQKSDPSVYNFHFNHEPNDRFIEQHSCFLTRTNSKTLEIIREHKELSPLFNGQIKAIGPRYCPSIEDKAFRYPDRDQHQVFIEPEGLNLDSFYPNGLSSSLPSEIQLKFLRTINGLEHAEIMQPGYAVEYDVVDTSSLRPTLEHIEFNNLYFAGQINGTSGYEEAAGQGLVAGLNAALKLLKGEEFILDRNESYIGVMVEDLVTNLRDEPYRLFTARSENRLYLREDNSYLRLYNYRKSLKLRDRLDLFLEELKAESDLLSAYCQSQRVYAKDLSFYPALAANLSPKGSTLMEVLKRADIDPAIFLADFLRENELKFKPQSIRTSSISVKYEGYIQKMLSEIEKIKKFGAKQVEWESLSKNANISYECRQRIKKIRPSNFSQLKNIEGIRPATLALVAGKL